MFTWLSPERAYELIEKYHARNLVRYSDPDSKKVYKYAYIPWVVHDLIICQAYGFRDFITEIYKLEPGSYLFRVDKLGTDFFWIDVTFEGKDFKHILEDSFVFDFYESK